MVSCCGDLPQSWAAQENCLGRADRATWLIRLIPWRFMNEHSIERKNTFSGEPKSLKGNQRLALRVENALNSASREKEIDLKIAGVTRKAAAEILNLGAVGLKRGDADVESYRMRLKIFVKSSLLDPRGNRVY